MEQIIIHRLQAFVFEWPLMASAGRSTKTGLWLHLTKWVMHSLIPLLPEVELFIKEVSSLPPPPFTVEELKKRKKNRHQQLFYVVYRRLRRLQRRARLHQFNIVHTPSLCYLALYFSFCVLAQSFISIRFLWNTANWSHVHTVFLQQCKILSGHLWLPPI